MVRLFDTDEMNRWTPLPSPFDITAAEQYVDTAHRLRAQGGTLQLAITEDGRTPLGEVLVFPGSDEDSVELAFAVGADHQGGGLARRAVQAVLALASNAGASRAELVIAVDNVRSQRVARATGFRHEWAAADRTATQGLRLDDGDLAAATGLSRRSVPTLRAVRGCDRAVCAGEPSSVADR